MSLSRTLIPYLVAEAIEEADRVDLQYRMHRPSLRLQVLEDMLREELHYVNKGIRRSNTVLYETYQ